MFPLKNLAHKGLTYFGLVMVTCVNKLDHHEVTRSGVTWRFQFISAAAAAKTYAYHIKSVCAKP